MGISRVMLESNREVMDLGSGYLPHLDMKVGDTGLSLTICFS